MLFFAVILVVHLQGLSADHRYSDNYAKMEVVWQNSLKYNVYFKASKNVFGRWDYKVNHISLCDYNSNAIADGTITVPECIEYDNEVYMVNELENISFKNSEISSIIVEGNPAFGEEFQGFTGEIILKKGAIAIYSDDAFSNFEGTLTNYAIDVTQGFYDAIANMDADKTKLKCRYSIYDTCKEKFVGEVIPFGLKAWIIDDVRMIDCYKFKIGYYGDASEDNLTVTFKDATITPDNGEYKITHISPKKKYEVIFNYEGENFANSIPVTYSRYVGISEPKKYEGKIEGEMLRYDGYYDDLKAYEAGIKYCEMYYGSGKEEVLSTAVGNYNEAEKCFNYKIENLFPGNEYKLYPYIIIDGDCILDSYYLERTSNHHIELNYSSTETTCTLNSVKQLSSDGTVKATSVKLLVNGETHDIPGYKLTGLRPQPMDNESPINAAMVRLYIGEEYFDYRIALRTQRLGFVLSETITPTGILFNPKFTSQELELDNFIIASNFGDKITSSESKEIWLGSLRPNTTYTMTVTVNYKTKDGKTESYAFCRYNASKKQMDPNISLTTPSLSLSAPETQPVSATSARVSAETNIDDRETNIGFQWKKYEAPASLKPSEGYGILVGGSIEGLIKNLQSSSFYNVRTFYKNNAGNYYYSEWVTFDPSDFSYFEPTVHTFAAENISGTSAELKGCVIPGSDNIIEQGFQYWKAGSDKVHFKAAPVDGYSTVFSSGQRMSATIEDLASGTEYHFRSYAKTDAGNVYGEEMTFITHEVAGIEQVEIDNENHYEIVGYYTISGAKINMPQRGLNIIRYSDGSVKKIFVK